MIDRSGRLVLADDKGLFHFPGNDFVRCFQHKKTIVPEPGLDARELWALLVTAWGDRAAVAVAWVVARGLFNRFVKKQDVSHF